MSDIEERYERMYEFENNSHLYKFRFKDTGIPMWMYVRSFFIRNITDRNMDRKYNNSHERKSVIKKKFIEKYIIKNPFLTHRKEILFAFWGYDCLRKSTDNMIYDPLIMPYLDLFPNNVITIMSGNILTQDYKKCVHPNWKMDDIFTDALKIVKYLNRKHDICLEDKKNIRDLIKFVNRNCPLQVDNNLKMDIVNRLKDFAANSKFMIKLFEVYLDIVKPKVVVICCASYPDIIRTPMILACRNKGVITAELQHGLSSKYHPYYQYCDFIVHNKECSKMLTDYLLVFGEYWKNKINVPQKQDVLGYAKTIVKDTMLNTDNILLCAGIDFDRYIYFLEKLLILLDTDTTIYFRFHPLCSTEKQRKRFRKYLKYPNFVFANDADLSSYLEKCRYVIVDGSTVAYEALFTGRVVFTFNSVMSHLSGVSELTDVYVFNNADDFIALWNRRNTFEARCHNEFYELNYKENYIKFLEKCGVDTSIK